jgi:alkylhydroperoxidase family enzyme
MRRMDIPRVDFERLPAELAAALQPRARRLGYLGEFFRCAAHQPAALLSFMRFTDDLKGALPDNLTEVVALTVAAWMGNAYERNQHEHLCRKLGLADEWIRAVNALQPDVSAALEENERRVQRLALAVLEGRGHGVQAQLDAVIAGLGAAQAMAVLMLIGRYVTHAFIVNALELAPPVPSIFEERGKAPSDEH